ncbi:MAG: arsenate reductase/protein-tyrosine-phosphatase family protein [Promethearchaeota archaeon]
MNKFPYKNIVIACSVNTARSRMVEGYLKDFFSSKGMDVKICSGGIASNARDGMLISLDARLAMKEDNIHLREDALSIDLKKHPNYLEQADLIITLTETHKKEVLKCLKSNDKVILTLREFAGETGNIEDPSMKGLEGFRIARDEIKRCVMKGLQRYF